jgi:hypothetical protein
MKRIITWILITIAYLMILINSLVYRYYSYEVKVGQYLELSDDASTAKVKLEYLKQFIDAIEKNITRNDARYIFKKERLTKDAQLKIIKTLQTRLEETAEMKPESFEYQQAMSQISGQEYDHTFSEIDNIIRGCWSRQNDFALIIPTIALIGWIIATLILINWDTFLGILP